MFRVRAKTVKGKSLSGPSYAETFGEAVEEAQDTAKAAGETLVLVSVRHVEGTAGKIVFREPRKNKRGIPVGKGKK